VRLIRNAGLAESRWPNGAGRKSDIATGDGWLVGFAWLDQDAPFSSLPGIDRTITLVQGPGFTLDIASRPALVVDTAFQPAPFDGGAPTQCRIAGPCRVLNVMTARERLRHSVTIQPASDIVPVAGAIASFLVVLQGSVTASAGTRLVPAVLDAIELDGPVHIEGSADAVLAHLTIETLR
jgi:environmental stress-induced protein Ves